MPPRFFNRLASVLPFLPGFVLGFLLACAGADAAPLPALKVDPREVSVSGTSSGGYMAVQLHVAYSGTFSRGVGVVAAGPFYCAEGSAVHATGRCLSGEPAAPVDALVAITRQWSALGWIDPIANLQGSRAYLFTGSRDTAVRPPLGDALQRWYTALMPAQQITHRKDVAAEHGMVTDDYGNACEQRGLPFIQDCDFDLAGEVLRALHGPLAPRNQGALAGDFIEFDQFAFVPPGRGMGPKGWLFVPPGCAADAAGASGACKLHVVLHGCGQNVEVFGRNFVLHTGYNRWADINRIVLLYPQTSPEATNSCWDWWGYTGVDYARKSGVQMAAIKAMVERLAGVAAKCHTAFNNTHVFAGRASYGWWGKAVATGSRREMGYAWQRSSLREAPVGHFVPAPRAGCLA